MEGEARVPAKYDNKIMIVQVTFHYDTAIKYSR